MKAALDEDLGEGDLTTRLCVPAGTRATAVLEGRAPGIFAGGSLLGRVYRLLDRSVKVEGLCPDGSRVRPGQVLARLRGPARALLSGERVALNLLQRLSGVATLTRSFVDAARKGSRRVQVLDTRKTTPGMRLLEKYAVACGGGNNHRLRLDDAILIKDNHLKAAGSLAAALSAAKRGGLPVEVEVEDLEELDQALAGGADCVLLDNFSPARLRAAMRRIRTARSSGRPLLIEASGGVTLSRIGAIAATGVDRISVGALTHSAPALNLALEFSLA